LLCILVEKEKDYSNFGQNLKILPFYDEQDCTALQYKENKNGDTQGQMVVVGQPKDPLPENIATKKVGN